MRTSKKRGTKIRRGRPPKGTEPERDALVRLYQKEGRAVRDIAEELGCSKDMVFRSLKKHGIATRSRARRSSLEAYTLEFLEEGLRANGLRGFARKLRIDKSTLMHNINKRKQIT